MKQYVVTFTCRHESMVANALQRARRLGSKYRLQCRTEQVTTSRITLTFDPVADSSYFGYQLITLFNSLRGNGHIESRQLVCKPVNE